MPHSSIPIQSRKREEMSEMNEKGTMNVLLLPEPRGERAVRDPTEKISNIMEGSSTVALNILVYFTKIVFISCSV